MTSLPYRWTSNKFLRPLRCASDSIICQTSPLCSRFCGRRNETLRYLLVGKKKRREFLLILTLPLSTIPIRKKKGCAEHIKDLTALHNCLPMQWATSERLHQMGRRDIWFTNINSVSFLIRIPLGFFVSLLVSWSKWRIFWLFTNKRVGWIISNKRVCRIK